MDSKTHKMLKK